MVRGIVFGVFFTLFSTTALIASDITPEGMADVEYTFGQLPLYFVENQGQIDSDEVAFYVKGADKTLYFTNEGITFSLQGDDGRWTVKLHFVGANPIKPIGQDRQEAVFSYFKSKPEDWNTGLPTYSKLVYEDLWPGIDLVYSGTVDRLKYEFVVKPGSDPGKIRLAYRGVNDLTVRETGELKVSTGVCSFDDGQPFAYQESDGERIGVSVRYSLEEVLEEDEFSYGFELGTFDPEKPLILDPVIHVYCGYIGGTAEDRGYGVSVDTQGNAYVTGWTASNESTFPVTAGPDLTFNGDEDAFVAKLDPEGKGLIYCGYIGGHEKDHGLAIASDDQGNAYVVGVTHSKEDSFPATVGPDTTFNGDGDAFVAKINSQGTDLLYCGYIGGDRLDYGWGGIAVDSQGYAYVTGNTWSYESDGFPVLVGPDLYHNGNLDAFVAKIAPNGANLEYCGYIGGIGHDYGDGIAVDDLFCAYVTGYTESSESSFPETVGPCLTYSGSGDAFVAKIDSNGAGLLYCGYIGGDGVDWARGISVDGDGNAYVAGHTGSTESSFPLVVGPDLTYNGSGDAFVAKIDSQGVDLLYCGYIGGSSADRGMNIVTDSQQNAYITGFTNSKESSFPLVVGPDLSFNGGLWDAFAAKVNSEGKVLLYCGYIGGSNNDYGLAVATDINGDVYVVGTTGSNESSFPIVVGPDLTFNGANDAFVTKLKFFESIDIKANGQDDPLTLNYGTNLTIDISLDPGDDIGDNADWWLLADSPFGWYRYKMASGSWVPGFVVTYQGPLNVIGPMTVYNGSGLPLGTYEFYFGVDLDMNGSLDMGQMYYDSVSVTVQ